MNNEVAFFIHALFTLTAILILFRFGKVGLLAGLIINLILVSIFGAALKEVFGYTTNMGNVFYAATFLAMNIFLEHYGPKQAYRYILIGFFSIGFFTLIAQFAVSLTLSSQTSAVNSALQTLFAYVPRITTASLIAYLCAHLLNIRLYTYLRLVSHGKNL